MRLLVANFDAQSIVPKEEVVQAVTRLPMEHIEGIQVIRYDPKRLIGTTLTYMMQDTSILSSQGLFYHDRKSIVIVLFRFNSRAEFYHVLYHEIGHYVFLKVLPQILRDKWMYQVRVDEPAAVSVYASRNAREDFAESYAYWMSEPERLLSFPRRQAYFEQDIFA